MAINVEKGGAGKTMIACHLAWVLADAGHRVLFLDLDRQCNATDALADFESLGTCKPLFEPNYVPPTSLPRLSIYSNRMGGEYDADYPRALTNINRSEEHTSELQSLMRTSYAVFCLKKHNSTQTNINNYPTKPTHKQ